ncbi:uncharacterized protein HaLaN_03823 [Haematococcus lacustris]|uniref:Uncharacterized protein n=1 Tax=Haematococcus lacustris TaxID=44745 RepID=A0A699YRE1_HAELA|nr:uncharacterized protein HaLaN_03823 [Haematococcus lacustris]
MDQLPDSLLRQADAKAAAEQPGADVKFPPLMVASILEQLKVEFQAGQSTQDGLAVVHFALEPQPGRQVALQVLFEYQHTSNTGQLLGPAQFETRVLEMNGWERRL